MTIFISLKVIKILMDKGVDVNIKDNGNHTPRDLATASGCQATVLEALTPSQVSLYLSVTLPLNLQEALVNFTDEHGRYPLHKAADTGNEEAMSELINFQHFFLI